MKKRSFDTREAAHYIGLSESHLRQARMTSKSAQKKDAPKYIKITSKKVVYLIEELDRWLDSHKGECYE